MPKSGCFPANTGSSLRIDETALSNGELYTIVTNKAAKGQKGALVAMIKGTQAEQDYFFIKCGNKYGKIPFEDILYVEGCRIT